MCASTRFVIIVTALTSTVAAAESAKPRVAVLEIRAERGVDGSLTRLLDEVMLSELSSDYEVIGKSDIASMLGFEQQKQMLGCTEEASCLAEIGGALGVDMIISGNLGQVGSMYLINLKVIDAKKAKVLKRITETVKGSEDQLVGGLQKAVARIKELAPEVKGAALTPAVEPPKTPEIKPEPAPVPIAIVAPPPPASPAGPSNGLAYTLLGLGGASIVGGAYFGVQALGTRNDVTANLKAETTDVQKDDTLRATYSRQAWLANGLVGGGLVLAVVGWLLRDPGGSGGDVAMAVEAVPGGAVFRIGGTL